MNGPPQQIHSMESDDDACIVVGKGGGEGGCGGSLGRGKAVSITRLACHPVHCEILRHIEFIYSTILVLCLLVMRYYC